MAVPKFYEFFGSVLRSLQDGEVHKSKDVRTAVAKDMHLTDADMAEQLPSQRQTTYANRILWAKTYLDKAGLVETVARGQYTITAEGLKALQSGSTIDLDYLRQYDSFRKFQGGETLPPQPPGHGPVPTPEEEKTPEEIMEDAFGKINASLASKLMDEVMKQTPKQFEELVVKLLIKMGYGDGTEDAGKTTQYSGDGGIDGIVREDQLGFDKIFIQAKQWARDRTVDRPELNKFIGALHGANATKGLFITTASFTKGARDYVKNLSGLHVVLVDGDLLAKYMIKHNLGVAVSRTYEIKKIDTDFFNDEDE